jgi:hypothetical protein
LCSRVFTSDQQVFVDTTITGGIISGAVIPEPPALALAAVALAGGAIAGRTCRPRRSDQA